MNDQRVPFMATVLTSQSRADFDFSQPRFSRQLRKFRIGLTNRTQRGVSHFVTRAVELLFVAGLLLLTSPLWLLAMVSMIFGRRPLVRRRCIGIHGVLFQQFQFQPDELFGGRFLCRLPVESVPALLNVAAGSQSLVGPRPAAVGEVDTGQREIRNRLTVKPGLISPWSLLRKANIAFEPEWEQDLAFVQNHTLRSDLGVICRSLPRMFAAEPPSYSPRGELFGVPFDNVTMTHAIDQIITAAQQPGLTTVSFINADCLNKAFGNSDYKRSLSDSTFVYCDGVGTRLAGKFLGCPVRENVNGTDMLPRLCEELAKSPVRVFLLGGRPGVALDVEKWITEKYPRVTVSGTQHGFFAEDELRPVTRRISESGADVVLVAFGAPKQELWIQEHLPATGVRVAIGVGGLFDFYSGRIPRAPAWMRELGIEWVFRLMQEPGRMWRRYLVGNVVFLTRVFQHKFFPKNDSTGINGAFKQKGVS